jgi:hypothetical protein
MKMRQFIPFVLVLLAVGFANFSQWCTSAGHLCYRTILDQIIPGITYPLYFFALYLLPLTIVLIFVSRSVFNSWFKLAVWLIPLALIFVSTQPVVAGFLSTDRDDAARFSAGVVTAVSFLLLIWKWFAARRQGR